METFETAKSQALFLHKRSPPFGTFAALIKQHRRGSRLNRRIPACPSSAAFNAFFVNLKAVGEFRKISLHHVAVSRSKSLKGTTQLTNPIFNASFASYILAKNHISLAFFCPINLAMCVDPYPASNDPTFGPVCPNTALSARDGQIANHVQNVRLRRNIRNRCDHWFRQSTNLHL